MSASGAGVLQLRSVEYARNHGVRIHCRSSFTEEPGYLRRRRGGDHGTPADHRRHALHRRGARHAARRARPPRRRRPHLHRAGRGERQRRHDHPERAGVRGPAADMSFTVPRATCAPRARRSTPSSPRSASRAVADDPEMGKVSVVGAGMKSHPGVAAKVFTTLGDQGINIEMISTSPIKISCVIARRAVDRAVRALHERLRARAPTGPGRASVRAKEPAYERYRVAVVGATGAVGTVMLRKLRERGFPAREIVPFASERSAGRELEGAHRASSWPRTRSRASTSRSSRAGGAHLRRVGAAVRRRRRGGGRQLVRVGGATTSRWSSPRSTRRRSTATTASSPTRTARPCS